MESSPANDLSIRSPLLFLQELPSEHQSDTLASTSTMIKPEKSPRLALGVMILGLFGGIWLFTQLAGSASVSKTAVHARSGRGFIDKAWSPFPLLVTLNLQKVGSASQRSHELYIWLPRWKKDWKYLLAKTSLPIRNPASKGLIWLVPYLLFLGLPPAVALMYEKKWRVSLRHSMIGVVLISIFFAVISPQIIEVIQTSYPVNKLWSWSDLALWLSLLVISTGCTFTALGFSSCQNLEEISR